LSFFKIADNKKPDLQENKYLETERGAIADQVLPAVGAP
jgi:hypothetical protein